MLYWHLKIVRHKKIISYNYAQNKENTKNLNAYEKNIEMIYCMEAFSNSLPLLWK